MLGTRPFRKRFPIYLESFLSSLLPLTVETHLGFTMATLTTPSGTFQMKGDTYTDFYTALTAEKLFAIPQIVLCSVLLSSVFCQKSG